MPLTSKMLYMAVPGNVRPMFHSLAFARNTYNLMG